MAISKNADNGNELFPVVDRNGNVTGSATRAECHGGSRLLHPVVHLHVSDSSGRLYLQRRPEWKDIQPGKWDTAVGGHVDFGEKPEEALLREAREELGISGFVAEKVTEYVFESEREREYVHVWRAVVDSGISPTEELDGGRFWSAEEISLNIGKGVFTPNFENEYQTFLQGTMQ